MWLQNQLTAQVNVTILTNLYEIVGLERIDTKK